MKITYRENCIIGQENDGSDIRLKDYQKALLGMFAAVVEVLERDEITYFIEGGTLLGAIRHQDIIPWDDDIDICFMQEDYPKVIRAFQKLDAEQYAVQCFDTDHDYDITQPTIKVRKKNTFVEYDAIYARNNAKEKGIFIDCIAFSKIPESIWVNRCYRIAALIRTLFLLFFNKLNINVSWLKRYHIKQSYKFEKKAKNTKKIGYSLVNVAWQNNVWKENEIFPLKKVTYNHFQLPAPGDYDRYLKKLYGDYMKFPDLNEVELLHSNNLRLKSGYIIKK